MKTKWPSKTPTLDAFAAVQAAHAEASDSFEKILRRRGWEYTSSTPGCIWMWQKKLPDGRTILTNAETAKSFEEQLCGEEYEAND